MYISLLNRYFWLISNIVHDLTEQKQKWYCWQYSFTFGAYWLNNSKVSELHITTQYSARTQ